MKTHSMIQPKAAEMFAMRTYCLPVRGAHRVKQILAGLFLGTLLGAIPSAWGGNPELPVDLGSAGDFAILAGTGISTVPSSAITGDIGTSPAVTYDLNGGEVSLYIGRRF
ncbi:MAG: hypothetical protein PHO37_06305 [Kiritimatiellae bacterium]|nr:hypothetical protein [Kiritimatiellia bacterium]